MIWATLTGLPKWVRFAGVALLAAALLLGLWIWFGAREEADDKANQSIGATVQREGDLREILNRTEQANAARDEVDDDRGTARYDQCLRTARTPENCQRFLPRSSADQR